jgi:hypothetical protein
MVRNWRPADLPDDHRIKGGWITEHVFDAGHHEDSVRKGEKSGAVIVAVNCFRPGRKGAPFFHAYMDPLGLVQWTGDLNKLLCVLRNPGNLPMEELRVVQQIERLIGAV